MIAHVWGMLVPLGEFAARTNFLSALLSACAAGWFFLVAHESLRDLAPRLRLGAAAAGGGAGRVRLHQLAEQQRDRGLRGRDLHDRRDVVAGDALAPPPAHGSREPRGCSS